MAVPTNSPLLEKLNRALLKVMQKDEWDGLLKKYLSSGS
jgi:ABC-type amino acid transport substrate-binding protein